MLRLCGRLADGWLPSLGGRYLSPEDAADRQAAIDEAARASGRDPDRIERAVNVLRLDGDPSLWADRLARIASELRFSTLLISVPDEGSVDFVRRLGEDVAPRVRELLG
jgi:alkanesulfonate monooxygenase SsuD/methylene tetrahydromethanopterin reductase-like flavin-dependent oxidoreductase (luciferase family)